MKSLLLFISLFAVIQAVGAQTPTQAWGVGTDPRPSEPCLTPRQHSELKALLQTKLKLLARQNPRARKAANHPYFIFPLQKAKPSTAFTVSNIVNFVDHSPTVGPNSINQYGSYNLDFNCGNRTYNQNNGYKHSGTDIALYPYDWQMMAAEEVKVVAAAPGIIVYKSDGKSDQSCGSFATGGDWNAVYIQHADGSVAWYGHLKTNSLTAKPVGATVEVGEFIGYVGSSGRSSGPHLHFEVYDANNKLIDPFQGNCNAPTADSWWQQQPEYAPKILNRISIHRQPPVLFTCPPASNQSYEITYAQPGQLLYFYAFGLNMIPGDAIVFELFRPDGTLQSRYLGNNTNTYATFYWYNSLSLPANAPLGLWQMQVTYGGQSYRQPFTVTTYAVCESFTSGSWHQSARWSCGRVPLATDPVQISPGHIVTIDPEQTGQASLLWNKGRLIVGTGGRLQLGL